MWTVVAMFLDYEEYHLVLLSNNFHRLSTLLTSLNSYTSTVGRLDNYTHDN